MSAKGELLQEVINAVPGVPDYVQTETATPMAEWGWGGSAPRVRVAVYGVGEVLVQQIGGGGAEIRFSHTPPSVIGSTIHRLRRLA